MMSKLFFRSTISARPFSCTKIGRDKIRINLILSLRILLPPWFLRLRLCRGAIEPVLIHMGMDRPDCLLNNGHLSLSFGNHWNFITKNNNLITFVLQNRIYEQYTILKVCSIFLLESSNVRKLFVCKIIYFLTEYWSCNCISSNSDSKWFLNDALPPIPITIDWRNDRANKLTTIIMSESAWKFAKRKIDYITCKHNQIRFLPSFCTSKPNGEEGENHT